jgi:hypothetical protein
MKWTPPRFRAPLVLIVLMVAVVAGISRFIPNSFRRNDEEYAPTLPDFFLKAPQIHFYP